jgi:hypothetical protein
MNGKCPPHSRYSQSQPDQQWQGFTFELDEICSSHSILCLPPFIHPLYFSYFRIKIAAEGRKEGASTRTWFFLVWERIRVFCLKKQREEILVNELREEWSRDSSPSMPLTGIWVSSSRSGLVTGSRVYEWNCFLSHCTAEWSGVSKSKGGWCMVQYYWTPSCVGSPGISIIFLKPHMWAKIKWNEMKVKDEQAQPFQEKVLNWIIISWVSAQGLTIRSSSVIAYTLVGWALELKFSFKISI